MQFISALLNNLVISYKMILNNINIKTINWNVKDICLTFTLVQFALLKSWMILSINNFKS